MKILISVIFFSLISFSAQAACNSYLVDEKGEGEVIAVYKSNGFLGIFFACSIAYNKCLKNLDDSSPEAVCISKKDFQWKQVQEIAHQIDKKSKLLHRDLENFLGGHDDDSHIEDKSIIELVHELAENAHELHETVENYKARSKESYQEYLKVKGLIQIIDNMMSQMGLPNELQLSFEEIKSLFTDLRSFYWRSSWFD